MSACEVVGKPLFGVDVHVCVEDFLCEGVSGTVSKALLMSIVARSVRCAGFGVLRPSRMVCDSVVRSVVVEC